MGIGFYNSFVSGVSEQYAGVDDAIQSNCAITIILTGYDMVLK